MYSRAAAFGIPEASYTWNFGDGSPLVNAVDTFNTYATPASYNVTLTDTIFGWRIDCTDDTTITLNTGATAAFSSNANGLTVSFSDQSINGANISQWLWDFGDGNTSTQQNPTHTYAANGNYTVCLTIDEICGAESS